MNTKFIKAIEECCIVANLDKIKTESQIGRIAVSSTLYSIFVSHFPTNNSFKSISPCKDIVFHYFDDWVAKRQTNKRMTKVWVSIFTSLDKLIKTLYPNEKSCDGVLTKIRSIIKKYLGNDSPIYKESIIALGPSHERRLERREEYASQVRQRGMGRHEQEPFYFNEVCQVIDRYLFSDDPIYQIVAVMLVTGSRLIEVLRISTYTPTCVNNMINIVGIAKGDSDINSTKSLTRPLIHRTCEEVCLALDQLRSKLDLSGSNSNLSARYNARISHQINRAFPHNDVELTSHKLRYISSNLAYLKYGNGSIENLFIQRFLGHADGQSSLTYQCINCTLDPPPEREEVKEELSHTRLDYPELKNTNVCRNAIARSKKEANILEILRRAKRDGIFIGYDILRKDYKYGTTIVDKILKKVRSDEIVL